MNTIVPDVMDENLKKRFKKRIGKTALWMLVASEAALATSSETAEPALTLVPTDPATGQPDVIAAKPTGSTQEGSSWLVIARDENALAPEAKSIWQGEVGEGFRSDVRTFSLETGVALGVQAFGGRQVHDLALLSLSYGHMLGNVVGGDHWYHGNWEARAELFGGGQFSPRSDELVGLAPHLRYNLATGTRWVPFADLGAGVTASGIGPPDQSGTFEFNLQANFGTHWFLRDNLALTFEVGYLHMSCAGLHDPNLGVNTVKGMAGLTWFF
jgi:hypothetical protein